MNNASFGMTVQKLICDEYGIVPNDEASKQFESNFDKKYAGVKKIIPKIFNEIGYRPEKCITFEKNESKGKKFKSPHNFFLNNGSTLSIKTTLKKRSMVAPQVIGQAGYKTLNYHFGHLIDYEIKSREDIKKLMWTKIDSLLPIFVDYLFTSDILIWIYRDKNSYKYKIIYRNEKMDFIWYKNKITFTKKHIDDWKESLTVKYDKVTIAEIQVHKNRSFKFRFLFQNLIDLLIKREKNNETFGISVENEICKIFNLDKPKHLEERSDKRMMEEAYNTIMDAFCELPSPINYVGDKKGTTGKNSKSPIDFKLEGDKSLSVKTNIGKKVCPPEIGQPSLDTFKKHFAYLISDLDNFNVENFKKIAMENTAELLNSYLKYLLDCDYLLWIYKENSNHYYKILSKDMNFHFEKDKITFTRDLETWNESNTVKYCGMTIGEFQVHSKRNSLKFRFDMKNLIALLEKKD